jgi:uncharacterized coiled-coil DUF342 family protein
MERDEILNQIKSLKQDLKFVQEKYMGLLVEIEKYLKDINEYSN